MWQAAVGLNLPLRRARRAGARAEAEALREAALSRLTATDLQLRLRTQERLAQLTAAHKASELYREGVIPQDRMSVEAAMASYQAGRVPFITVLESLTTLYGDRATLLRLLAGGARVQASLDEAGLEATSDLPALAPASAAGSGGMGTGGTGGGAMGSMSR
jgi:outer membrane protein TolC